jgi:hypothetical protein
MVALIDRFVPKEKSRVLDPFMEAARRVACVRRAATYRHGIEEEYFHMAERSIAEVQQA